MERLAEQFKDALTRIEIKGAKRERVIEAHTEIREVLEKDPTLSEWGVDTVLIGSYARNTGVHPGKDVDVFVRLTELDTRADPGEVFDEVKRVLSAEYGSRASAQRRSMKVEFDTDGDGFAVDAVPAVVSGDHWAIPNSDSDSWSNPDAERWMETDPLKLAELVSRMNAGLQIGGRGAFVPTVKLARQTRRHHLGDAKPGGLYIELLVYRAFEDGIEGESFAEVLAATLRSIADHLASDDELIDPALGSTYTPALEPDDRERAAEVFGNLADQAEGALSLEKCPAALAWRQILGKNNRGWCFPLPPGCDEQGKPIRSLGAVTSVGSKEAGSFA